MSGKLEAGRELDRRIAVEVMGWPAEEADRAYSTDLAAAWLVVEHLRERFGQVELYGERNHFWDCVVSDWGGMTVLAREGAETPMLAVCRAALAAMPAGDR